MFTGGGRQQPLPAPLLSAASAPPLLLPLPPLSTASPLTAKARLDRTSLRSAAPAARQAVCCFLTAAATSPRLVVVAGAQLEASLMKASENGKWPIVCDTSPCLSQIKAGLSDPALR